MGQETSQSLISHSQTRDPDSSIVESSQSIIPHSLEHGLGSTDETLESGMRSKFICVKLERVENVVQ